jgi:hypothetical protein
VYVAGDLIGADIAVVIITLVRGIPDKAEQEAAQSGALPMPASDGSQPPSEAKDPAGGVA